MVRGSGALGGLRWDQLSAVPAAAVVARARRR
ncbi:hypothetical protein GA0115241_109017, partial [Streptomyces sp. DpondAA-D4]